VRSYRLRCTACGALYEDDGVRLDCSRLHAPALLRSVYDQRAFRPRSEASIARYQSWLPLAGDLVTGARSAVYRSESLGAYLGLRRLYVAFSGWWPQREATLASATFKELEAVAVLGRLDAGERRTLVVASAGNTAAAFAQIATERDRPILIVVPLDAWEMLAAQVRIGPTVRVVAVEHGTYDDAIVVAKGISVRDGYAFEGGVRNVGRRDGMGTALLAGVEAIGRLPDAYVQAVGSAAGALAAHEAALRLLDDGRFGARLPRLLLAQNAPFTPIHDAWSRRSAVLDERSPLVVRDQLARIGAAVLSNQAPPYATTGGVRDALAASDGRTYAIGNDEMAAAMLSFAELEGIDVEPAAGVALAALARAARSGDVRPDDAVLVHVTGGGRARREPVRATQRPAAIVRRDDRAADRIETLFA
jgi:cysteate synthase